MIKSNSSYRASEHKREHQFVGSKKDVEVSNNKQPQSEFSKDFSEYKNTGNVKPTDLLLYASKLSKRSMWEIGREFKRLSKGRGKLTLQEYVDFEVYNSPEDEKDRFLSRQLVWPVTCKCCDMSWDAATEDKWLATQILELHDIPTPQILAVVDMTHRRYGRVTKLSNKDEFLNFVQGFGEPLFAKENRGLGSFGAFMITGCDGDTVDLQPSENVAVQTLIDDRIGERTYILQPLLQNSKQLRAIAKSLITLRLFLINDGSEICVIAAVLKVPSPESIADNFWRAGNVIGNVDLENGTITTAKTRHDGIVKDLKLVDTDMPEIIGLKLDGWDEAKSLAIECGKIFATQKFLSLDIAFTDQGTSVVEVNTGGGWELYQFASGKGFLSPQVEVFFDASGIDLENINGDTRHTFWKKLSRK